MQLAKIRVFISSFKLDLKRNVHLISSASEVTLTYTDVKHLKLIYEQLYPQKNRLCFTVSDAAEKHIYWQ